MKSSGNPAGGPRHCWTGNHNSGPPTQRLLPRAKRAVVDLHPPDPWETWTLCWRGGFEPSVPVSRIYANTEITADREHRGHRSGHRDPSTTKLYDRRGYNPEKAASFFATS
jgi:hypothetical protein